MLDAEKDPQQRYVDAENTLSTILGGNFTSSWLTFFRQEQTGPLKWSQNDQGPAQN